MTKRTEALKLALEALMRSRKAVSGDLDLAGCAYGKNDPDGHRYDDAKQALVTLDKAMTALREAQQPAPATELREQEPVAAECKFDREQKWVRCEIAHHNLVQSEPHNWPDYQTRLLYTSPPAQRTWVGLTDEEVGELLGLFPKYASEWGYGDFYQFARAIEAAHGITKE